MGGCEAVRGYPLDEVVGNAGCYWNLISSPFSIVADESVRLLLEVGCYRDVRYLRSGLLRAI